MVAAEVAFGGECKEYSSFSFNTHLYGIWDKWRHFIDTSRASFLKTDQGPKISLNLVDAWLKGSCQSTNSCPLGRGLPGQDCFGGSLIRKEGS